MPLPLSTTSAATSRKFLLLPLFPSPLRRGRREHIQVLRGPPSILKLFLLPLLLLLLQLLPPEILAQEEGDGGGVHFVAASQRRHHQERPRGSHVTDRASTCGSDTSSRDSSRDPELAIFCPRGATGTTLDLASWLWCKAAASSIATVCRSCRSHERSRRCLRRNAEVPAPAAMRPTANVAPQFDTQKKKKDQPV